MTKINNIISSNDPFELSRFINAQNSIYDRVLAELKRGYKQSHWMWYIFPQLDGLAQSSKSKYYAIKSQEEAVAYLNHPILGLRLLECANIVYKMEGKTASEIFGYPDDLKLKSSMTLFSTVASESVFLNIINKYFQGKKDTKTLQLLK
ncbi:MAG: DUF1810 domain-containing protein [Xenococcaceae cyanobacterium MO_167.B52]|nr:DUF1810 domain-containing protein [Xenococcaceae cyanobacterium MO_167.B52]